MIAMGSKVRDRITGFEGRVTCRTEYITGCTQILVVPKVKDDGSYQEAHWFDEQRLEVDTLINPVTLSPFDNAATPGCDKPAPIR
jgi:hypothetical protein